MSRPDRLLSCTSFLAVCLLIGSARGQNLEQSFYATVEPSAAPFHAQIDVPHFDPSLGTLIEARIVLTPHFVAFMKSENTDTTSPATVTLLFAGGLALNRGGSALANATSGGYVSQFLLPFDGSLDFTGVSGLSQNVHDDLTTTVSILPSSPEFDAFVGLPGGGQPEHLELNGALDPQCEPIGNPMLVFESRTAMGPEVTITYVYSTSGSSYCPGDGSATACPCGNSGLAGHGCSSPGTVNGALLSGTGDAALSGDTLTLTATDLPQSTQLILMQSETGMYQGAPFGAGVRCVTGTMVRIAAFSAGTSTTFGPSHGDPSISVAGSIPPGGGTRYYQVSYREPPGACNGSAINFTNGWRVAWRP
jgi:hypothetical protein